MVFFLSLPIGIKQNNKEFDDDIRGNDIGAPKNPNILTKFLITTILTTIIFFVIYYVVDKGYLNLREYLI